MKVTHTFDNGAVKYEISEGVEFGVDPRGLIYWATPEGWDWILDPDNPQTARETRKIHQDSSGWPGCWHDDYRFTPNP